jgi:hypothetical protein
LFPGLGHGQHHHPSHLPWPNPSSSTPSLLAQAATSTLSHPNPSPKSHARARWLHHDGTTPRTPRLPPRLPARRLGDSPLLTPPWRRHPGPTR